MAALFSPTWITFICTSPLLNVRRKLFQKSFCILLRHMYEHAIHFWGTLTQRNIIVKLLVRVSVLFPRYRWVTWLVNNIRVLMTFRMQLPQRLLSGTAKTEDTTLLSKTEILQLGSRWTCSAMPYHTLYALPCPSMPYYSLLCHLVYIYTLIHLDNTQLSCSGTEFGEVSSVHSVT